MRLMECHLVTEVVTKLLSMLSSLPRPLLSVSAMAECIPKSEVLQTIATIYASISPKKIKLQRDCSISCKKKACRPTIIHLSISVKCLEMISDKSWTSFNYNPRRPKSSAILKQRRKWAESRRMKPVCSTTSMLPKD